MAQSKVVYFAISFLLISVVNMGFGQENKRKRIHLELEPIQFINNGWSIVGHYTINDRVQVGTNLFSSQLSAGLTDFAFNTSGDIDVLASQDLGINISIRYFMKKQQTQKGFVVSLPIGWETWTLEEQKDLKSEPYRFFYLSPRIGYLWYPVKKSRLYILGEAIGIIPIFRKEDIILDQSSIAIRQFIPFPSLGIGYSF